MRANDTDLDAKNSMSDFITSCMGMFGPGCGPVHNSPSSGVIMTGGGGLTPSNRPSPSPTVALLHEEAHEGFMAIIEALVSTGPCK